MNARHRAETSPSVHQGSTGAPTRGAVGLFRQGQARSGTRASHGVWDTRSTEPTIGAVHASFTFHFPKALRAKKPDRLDRTQRRLAAATLGRSKAPVSRDLTIANPQTLVDAHRHPAMREHLTHVRAVVTEHQVPTIERGHLRSLIPAGTRPGLVRRAYQHASLLALHKAGLGDYDFHMDKAAKQDFAPLVPFMRYAHRRVFDKLNTPPLQGKWEPFRQEFGHLHVRRKFGKPTGETRMRMRDNQRFIKIDLGDLGDEALEKAWTGEKQATGGKRRPGSSAAPMSVAAQMLSRAIAAHRAGLDVPGIHHLPEPPGGDYPHPHNPGHSMKQAAVAVERHYGVKVGRGLHKRWDVSKHPREHDGKFRPKSTERAARFLSGGAGAIGGFVLGTTHGPKIGADIGRRGGQLYGKVSDAIRGQRIRGIASMAAEGAEITGGRIGRAVGTMHGAKIGAGLLGGAGALAGGLIGSGLDHWLSRRRAVKAGKLDQWKRLNAKISVVPNSRKQAKAAIYQAMDAGRKVRRAHDTVRQVLGKLNLGFSNPQLGDYNTNPAAQLRRAIHPRMRRHTLRLRLNTQRHLRHVLSGGITRQERWQLGATSRAPSGLLGKRLLTEAEVRVAARSAVRPTPAQAEAGNYRKGHVTIAGLPISIETPKGAARTGTAANGRRWSVKMPAHYGYIKRTEGADGDHVDVYLGPHAHQAQRHPVFVVDQQHAVTRRFDEHKAMLGFPSLDHATKAYDAAFSDGRGPARRRAIHHVTFDDFRRWVGNGDTTRPFATHRGATAGGDRRGLGKVAGREAAVSANAAALLALVDHSDQPVLRSVSRKALNKGLVGDAIRYGTGLAMQAHAAGLMGAKAVARKPIRGLRAAAAHPRVAPAVHEARGIGGYGFLKSPVHSAGRIAGRALGGERGARIGGNVALAADYAPEAALGYEAARGLLGHHDKDQKRAVRQLRAGTAVERGAANVLGKGLLTVMNRALAGQSTARKVGLGLAGGVALTGAHRYLRDHPGARALAGAGLAGTAVALATHGRAVRLARKAGKTVYETGIKQAVRDHLKAIETGAHTIHQAAHVATARRAAIRSVIQQARAVRDEKVRGIRVPKIATGAAALAGGVAGLQIGPRGLNRPAPSLS